MQHRWTTAREGRTRDGEPRSSAWSRVAALAAAALLTACGQGTSGPTAGDSQQHEHTGEAESAVFTNGGFEAGTAGQPPPGWQVITNLNPGITLQTPQTKAGLNLAAGGTALTVTLNAAGGPETQIDPNLGAGATFRWPKFGNKVAIVNGQGIAFNANGYGRNVNTLTQTMTVDAGDIDPIDGQIHVRATLAPVLENPNHAQTDQPYFFVQLTNKTTNKILYQDFNFSAQPGVAWKTANNGALYYTDWTLIDIPGGAGIKAGDSVMLEIIGGSCALGGHFGQVYVDSVGTAVPGLYVAATAPKAANAGTNITYTLNYKNGSPTDATAVVLDFNTPPNTTFVSYNAPGLTCTAPAAGQTGLVHCTLASLKAGVSGSYTITVNINAGAAGVITEGNYDIFANAVSPLYGSKVTTIIGCQQDSDCSAGNWCHVSPVAACLPTLPNGTAMPTDAAHANPTLNGTCSLTAGALVCTSAVCDSDNKCGYANGSGTCTQQNAATVCRSGVCGGDGKCGYPNAEGPCSAANAATVCRSAVCDPDLKCGYANGDGPCAKANQTVVCRSQSCSANNLCQPAGGCNVDGDCANGDWCNISNHVCAPKLVNGTAMPSDPPHANPTLDATCTQPAATLVCLSSVCDTKDAKCGYLNGDGPCTAQNGGTVCRSAVCDPDLKCGYDVNHGPCTKANAAVVCRSGACSANNLCEPVGGCNVDADCSNGNWCAEATHTCTPKLANGTGMPTDAPHSNPTLNAKCTAAAATLVCTSGVCDTKDDKCGYADLDGPCTKADGGTVCRSKACSVNGTCLSGGCNVDLDCAEGNFCMEGTHTCTPLLPNGSPIPTDPPHSNPTLDGTCTQASGALVCQSLVCDAKDNKCGFLNDDGPCTKQNQGVVCRSGACSVGGTCMPVGGCNVDGDCQAGNWCNIGQHTCTPQLANGTSIPTDVPHKNPTLDGNCTQGAGALVCVALVCDIADNKCGFANGDGPCTKQNQGVVCRSGACSNDGTCMPLAGCNIDSDCGPFTWCNMQNHACSPTLENGQPVPSDPAHKSPTLDGSCTSDAAKLTCISLVCDTKDNECGYADGDGPCDTLSGAIVCRSKTCSKDGLCMPAGGCNVDADCAQGQWCSISTNTCSPTLANGQPVPNDPPHKQPILNAACTPEAGALVCTSGVCDANDNLCGYADGSGPCTPQNSGIVCRSGACSANGLCEPSGGCNVDGDCAADLWCNTGTHTCVAKLPNGEAVPSDPGHKSPTLDGTCTPEAGKLVCASGVCDKDNLCGYADGTGPCTQNEASLCRSGACSHNGTCEPKTGCNVDGDCSNGDWCEETSHTCKPKLANGAAMPSDPPHSGPTLDGKCSVDAANLVCASGICDAADDKCGLADGDGPCTDANGKDICRSGICTAGVCGAPTGCKKDSECPAQKPVCDVQSGDCVECTGANSTKCDASKPVCDVATKTCVPCDGDLDSGASHACTKSDAPLCMNGTCGKCSKDDDCKGNAKGPICDLGTGTCLQGCHVDADCAKTEWCDGVGGAAGVCHTKLDNGSPLPKQPTTVSTCDDAVGARVCKSSVCDTKDNTCGLLPGDGPCNADNECRTTKCDLSTQRCALPTGCTKDAECPSGDYCSKAGACTPKQPEGTLCDSATQCQSSSCESNKCSDVIASGNGLCAVQNPGSSDDGGAFAALGLAIAAMGFARRRRARR